MKKSYDTNKDTELELRNQIAELKRRHKIKIENIETESKHKVEKIEAETKRKIDNLNDDHEATLDNLNRQLKRVVMDKMNEALYVYEDSNLQDFLKQQAKLKKAEEKKTTQPTTPRKTIGEVIKNSNKKGE